MPITIGEQITGGLHLTAPPGAPGFTDEDEEVILGLATAAGVAVQHSQMHLRARRERWLEVTAEITDLLLGQVDKGAALELVARRAKEAANAELAMVMLRDQATPDQIVVEVAVCDSGLDLTGARLPVSDDLLAAVITERRHALVDNLSKVAAWPAELSSGPAMLVPLATSEITYGALVVASPRGDSAGHTPAEATLVEAFASHAALAMERARAQRDRATLAVLEDRERIARDFHDVVIQRLFAAGLRLQNAISLTGRPEVANRLNTVVDDLDTTIRDIRASIFELRTMGGKGVRAVLHQVIDDARGTLGFEPALTIAGPVDSGVPENVRRELMAVLREAVANIVRHAAATAARVDLTLSPGVLELAVSDNGRGMGTAEPGGGLRNMEERARRLGGTSQVGPVDDTGGGVLVRWRVPLRRGTDRSTGWGWDVPGGAEQPRSQHGGLGAPLQP